MENKAPNAVPVVGLTGPTGAGKSTWAKAFASYGCIVIDCDALSRRAVEEPEVLAALQEAFGGDIVKDGALNRRLLAQRAFAGPEQAARLNAITHPAIRAMLYKALSDAKAQHPPMIFVDAPLLFEGGIDGLCDCTAAVLAPENVRLERICLRDGITEAEARARMANQHGDAYFRARVDVVFDGALPPGEIPEKALSWLRAQAGGVR